MKTTKNINKYTIHNPHDKALFKALEIKEVARDAMRAYLPDSLLKLTDLKIIRPYKTKLISPEFKEFEADVIYEIELLQQNALVLFHCEQQSTVDKYMPLRIWQYLLLVLMEYAKNHVKKPLPLIYPVILYTGEAIYDESTDFFDLFCEHTDLAKQHLLSPISLVDVCRMADEDIKKHKLFGLSEFAFKHKKTQQFVQVLQEMLPWLHDIELQLGKDYARMILRYVIDVYPEADYDTLVVEAKRYLSKELGDETMTIAQQLEQRGMQQEKYIIAKKLLIKGVAENLIAEATDLNFTEIKRLKNELESTKH